MVYSNNFGQSRVGVRNRVVNVVNSVDADAIAFIAAAGITNLTQAAAINTLVNDLKTYGLWTKMKALYPMVGGTATSHKFNLKDPRDLDAAYRLVFNGGWTHTSTGALPNGTTGYANTFLVPSTVQTLNSNGFGYYTPSTNTSTSTDSSPIGSYTSPSQSSTMGCTTTLIKTRLNNNLITSSTLIPTGLLSTHKTSNTLSTLYKNDSNVGSGDSGGTLPNYPIFFGTANVYGVPYNLGYVNNEFRLTYVSDGLSNTEVANFYTAVQKFQTTLGRQIGSPIVSDTDAQAFINAAGLTDLGQANAVNTLVVDLKSAGVWTKMKALYPFVGGNATSHKFNLKDPRDLDAAFRLVFNGGANHTIYGYQPNGANAYGSTKISPLAVLTTNNTHLSFYSRTSAIIAGQRDISIFQNGGNPSLTIGTDWLPSYTASGLMSDQYNTSTGQRTVMAITDATGLMIASRNTSTSHKLFRNGTLLGTNTTTNSSSLPTGHLYIGAASLEATAGVFQGVGGQSNKQYAFASIGDGLTDSEALAFYTAVQKYQTSLGRQIGTPVLAEGQTAGLLDTYSGAAAAYSLRKLRTGYVGNAIRVRRSSDNAEQDIAFDASGNLDTVSLLAFVGSGNGFVTTWYDQSGNGQHAVQTIASNQPYIVNAGVVNTYNSKPCVKFDGVDDFIQSPYATGTSNELYFVTQTTDTGFLFPRGYHGQGFIAEQGSTNTETSSYWTTQPQLYVNSTLRSPANRNDVYNLLNGYKLSLHKGANISNNWFYLRFGSFIQNGYLDFNGNLFEWVIYPTLQSSQSSIESNINTYYSIY